MSENSYIFLHGTKIQDFQFSKDIKVLLRWHTKQLVQKLSWWCNLLATVCFSHLKLPVIYNYSFSVENSQHVEGRKISHLPSVPLLIVVIYKHFSWRWGHVNLEIFVLKAESEGCDGLEGGGHLQVLLSVWFLKLLLFISRVETVNHNQFSPIVHFK